MVPSGNLLQIGAVSEKVEQLNFTRNRFAYSKILFGKTNVVISGRFLIIRAMINFELCDLSDPPSKVITKVPSSRKRETLVFTTLTKRYEPQHLKRSDPQRVCKGNF